MGFEALNATNCDFHGWATKNNVRCTDGLTIMRNAFAGNDGKNVPMVWNHSHGSPFDVLGHATLENRDDGVYAYCKFNETEAGKNAKLLVEHGDVNALSIYANGLKKSANNVMHGVIRELSLVLAGANPEATIQTVLAHSDDPENEFCYSIPKDAFILSLSADGCEMSLSHADKKDDEKKPDKPEEQEKSEDKPEEKTEDEAKPDSAEGKEETKMADEIKKTEGQASEDDKTVKEVFDSMTEEQKNVCYFMIGEALKSAKGEDNDDDEGGNKGMKHNAFDNEQDVEVLSHEDMSKIFEDAKRLGSLKEAVEANIGDGVLAHSIDTTGMTTATGNQTYGFNDPSMLFPEFKSLNNPPEWITRNMDWVTKVLGGVHRTPFSRIKSVFANITEDEARAKGYIKGKQKKDEVFTTLKRTTSPQTIYKKQKLDRDDVIDITDFDVVAWIRAEMRTMLNEEIARAILIGDGRSSMSDDKIDEQHVRPIATDVPLFNTQIKVTAAASDTPEDIAKAVIKAAIKGRKNYKGSGTPTLFTSEDWLTEMLLLEDGIGHKLYKTEAELATALRVKEIITVEPMSGHKIEINSTEYPLIGVIVNLDDYNVGADKGGAINMFDDFDIDLNQQKYLIETRISGALIKPFSALTLYLEQPAPAGNGG